MTNLSAEYTVTVPPAEVRIFIDHTPQQSFAHGLAFNENADIIAQRGSTGFVGFCNAEIVAAIVDELIFGRRVDGVFIDKPEINAALENAGLICHCFDDENNE